jgi:hypothetical protein
LLGESAELVADFLRGRLAKDGGFRGRADDEGDLYYTVFGLDGLAALDQPPPRAEVEPFLRAHGDGEGLDLIHLGALIRCWTALHGVSGEPAPELVERSDFWAERLATFHRDDGGWATEPDVQRGNTYGTFLAIAAYEDLGLPVPWAGAAVDFLEARQTEAGGFAPDPVLNVATTPTTAAGVTALRQLGAPPPRRAIAWLRRQWHAQGGFLPAPGAPMPDLLSTAVALHALVSLGDSLEDLAESALDFVDTLWTARGAFHGHWADDETDCEYTFYGLLALGHLSVWTR